MEKILEVVGHQTTSATEGNSFVETEVPLLLPTANATLMALQTYPAPCSIMVSGMTTRYWDRCIRCKTKKELQFFQLNLCHQNLCYSRNSTQRSMHRHLYQKATQEQCS